MVLFPESRFISSIAFDFRSHNTHMIKKCLSDIHDFNILAAYFIFTSVNLHAYTITLDFLARLLIS